MAYVVVVMFDGVLQAQLSLSTLTNNNYFTSKEFQL